MKISTGLICGLSLLLLSTNVASARPAAASVDLNVRAGEGTGHPVVGVIPQGSVVDVSGCGDGWCYVRNYDGFSSASYLDTYAAMPQARVYERPLVYGPPVRFGFHFGVPDRPWRDPWWW
jgi:uncharacterized protein YraI